MKYLGAIIDDKDLVTKEYVDSHGGGGLTIDDIYPLGSIYMSVNGTDPSVLFSGTSWTRIKDTFLLASGDDYAADDGTHTTATGGESTVRLTASESGVPSHSHTYTRPTVSSSGYVANGIPSAGDHRHYDYHQTVNRGSGNSSTRVGPYGYTTSGASAVLGGEAGAHTHNLPNHTHTLTGGGVADNTAAQAASAHNNMPPYLPIYMWKRTG